MSKRPTTKQMDAARDLTVQMVHRWKPLMGLGHWEIKQYFYRKASEVPKEHRRTKTARGALMWITTDWEYMQGHLHIYLPECVGMSHDALENAIRHELAHITVAEMREWQGHPAEQAIKHEERTVTMLAAAFLYTYDEGREVGRKERKKAKA